MLLHYVLKPQFVWSINKLLCSVQVEHSIYGSALPGLEEMNSNRDR